MKKMKIKTALYRLFFLLLMISAFPCSLFSSQSVTGDIVSAIILQERIHLNLGDKALTNLSSKHGIIKGDILTITTRHDIMREKPIGQCAVTGVEDKSSICEIISSNMEIEKGSKVSAPMLYYSMERFYPAVYKILSQAVEPFSAHEKIKISVYDIFDEKNNVTKFSDRLKQEMKNVFSQKKRLHVIEPNTIKNDFFLYPEDIKSSYSLRTEVMESLGVDVFITGSYTLSNDSVFLTFYKFDKNFNDEKISFQLPLNPEEVASTQEILLAFKPIPKKEYISCTVAIKESQYMPQKEEKREIITHEAGSDLFKTYDLRRTNFNIVSPVDILLKVDDKKVNFFDKSEVPILLTKGIHKLSVSFKRGYFFNTREPKLFISEKNIEKEVLLSLEKDASLYILISLNPSFENENINFTIYDVSIKKAQLLKSIIKSEAFKTIEFFKH